MTPERWERVKALFQSALEREPGMRSAFLAEACGEDMELRREVYELLEGETLRDCLDEGLPPGKAVDYAVQIAHGLAAAYEKGIVHRDLKPENIFVTGDGRIKILDFGIAKLREPSPATGAGSVEAMSTETAGGLIVGTVGYMSPEQVRGQPADHRSDIFAFGAVLYEMLEKTGPSSSRGRSDIRPLQSRATRSHI